MVPITPSRRDFLKLLGGSAALAAIPFTGWADPAPPLPMPRAGTSGFYPFKIGNLDAWILSDGEFISPVDPVWDASTTQDAAVAALRAAYLPTDKVTLEFNVLAVRVGPDILLVDSGCGSVFGSAGGRLPAHLRAAGLDPDKVAAIVVSHAHGDHVGGLFDSNTGQPIFGNAKVFINKAEADFWSGPNPDLSRLKAGPDAPKQMVSVAKAALHMMEQIKVERIEPGQKILPGIELFAAPGHTPGHCGVLVSSGNEQLLHLVDAAHHFALMFPHPDWSSGFDWDPALAAKTRRAIFDRAATDRTRVLGYHLPYPGIGHIRAEGKGYAWAPEPWGWA